MISTVFICVSGAGVKPTQLFERGGSKVQPIGSKCPHRALIRSQKASDFWGRIIGRGAEHQKKRSKL